MMHVALWAFYRDLSDQQRYAWRYYNNTINYKQIIVMK